MDQVHGPQGGPWTGSTGLVHGPGSMFCIRPGTLSILVWIGGTGVLQSILSSLILKVYHAFALKPITIKFGEFTNFWMLFKMTCPIFNLIDIECSYQEKICSYPVPCSFRTWPIPEF